ncbi:MAG: class I SAM-dependent methyltransferase [Verrucomicrobiae bacterium]|nr:class I SAM-dependent methyltransferase [Verrucomicrobiae bacterium]
MALTYSSRYYDGLQEDSAASAQTVVPKILRLFPARSVVDVGCGAGAWAREYLEAGCEVTGIDGPYVRADQLKIPADRFLRRDLCQPLALDRRFDLVSCLEVAEHLPGSRAEGLVADLCRLGDVVLFSAAVPGQGGTHHVNEQWPSYWIPRFEAEGFAVLDCLRPQLWGDAAVAWWYVQNLFAFVRRDRLGDFPEAQAEARPWPTDLVHPRAYVRATVPSQMSPRMLREVVRALPHFPRKVWTALR